jgi:hypothetical protein
VGAGQRLFVTSEDSEVAILSLRRLTMLGHV